MNSVRKNFIIIVIKPATLMQAILACWFLILNIYSQFFMVVKLVPVRAFPLLEMCETSHSMAG